MDQNHTVRENLDKVEALIDAVMKLQKSSNDLTFGAILFQLESLRVLAKETQESLETVRSLIIPKL